MEDSSAWRGRAGHPREGPARRAGKERRRSLKSEPGGPGMDRRRGIDPAARAATLEPLMLLTLAELPMGDLDPGRLLCAGVGGDDSGGSDPASAGGGLSTACRRAGSGQTAFGTKIGDADDLHDRGLLLFLGTSIGLVYLLRPTAPGSTDACDRAPGPDQPRDRPAAGSGAPSAIDAAGDRAQRRGAGARPARRGARRSTRWGSGEVPHRPVRE